MFTKCMPCKARDTNDLSDSLCLPKDEFDIEMRKLNHAVDLTLLHKKDKQHIQSLIKQNKFFVLFHQTSEGGPVIYVSRYLCEFTGLKEEELLGKTGEDVGRAMYYDHSSKDLDRLRALTGLEQDKTKASANLILSTKDGRPFSSASTIYLFSTVDKIDMYLLGVSEVQLLDLASDLSSDQPKTGEANQTTAETSTAANTQQNDATLMRMDDDA